MSNNGKINKAAIVFLMLFITYPIYYQILRESAFNVIPRDDYAPFLLHIIDRSKGEIPPAPFVYRFLSVVVAIPLYFLLPVYLFTNLGVFDISYYKALQALAMTSYLSIIGCSVMIYFISRRRLEASPLSSMIASFVGLLLSNFISRVGIDPFTVFIISLLVFWIPRKSHFAILVVCAVFVNEKIPFMFFCAMSMRYIWSAFYVHDYKSYIYQLAASFLSLFIYYSTICIFHFPGNEHQLNVHNYLHNLIANLSLLLTLKGIVLIIIPVMIMLSIVMIFIKEIRINERMRKVFSLGDVAVLAALLMLSLVVNVQYNVGRIVMLSFPIYLPALSCLLDRYYC